MRQFNGIVAGNNKTIGDLMKRKYRTFKDDYYWHQAHILYPEYGKRRPIRYNDCPKGAYTLRKEIPIEDILNSIKRQVESENPNIKLVIKSKHYSNK